MLNGRKFLLEIETLCTKSQSQDKRFRMFQILGTATKKTRSFSLVRTCYWQIITDAENESYMKSGI